MPISKTYMICNAYESGLGHGMKDDKLPNPHTPETDEHEAYDIGYRDGLGAAAKLTKAKHRIIKAKCNCGEPINIETGLKNVCRRDGKRPFYDGSKPGSTQFRCRKCHGWLGDTCQDAKFESLD